MGGKIPVQPVCRDTQATVAVRGNLVFARANGLDPVDPHEAADPTLADVEPGLPQLHRHPGTTVAAKAEAVLLPDMRQHLHVCPFPATDRPRAPRTKAALAHLKGIAPVRAALR